MRETGLAGLARDRLEQAREPRRLALRQVREPRRRVSRATSDRSSRPCRSSGFRSSARGARRRSASSAIARVGDVLLFTEEIFAFCFGSWGRRLYRGALGEDPAPVRTRPAADERFTVEEILEPDRVERRFLEGVLYRLAERLGERLRAERSLAGAVEPRGAVRGRLAAKAEEARARRRGGASAASDDRLGDSIEAARARSSRASTRGACGCGASSLSAAADRARAAPARAFRRRARGRRRAAGEALRRARPPARRLSGARGAGLREGARVSFVHLRVHSNFSMLAGTRPVEDLVRAAAAAGMPALALTDTDGMYAVVPFERACDEAGIQPIHGVELTGRQSGASTLLARTREGYGELCRLVDEAAARRGFLARRRARSISRRMSTSSPTTTACSRGSAGRRNAFAALPVATGREWTRAPLAAPARSPRASGFGPSRRGTFSSSSRGSISCTGFSPRSGRARRSARCPPGAAAPPVGVFPFARGRARAPFTTIPPRSRRRSRSRRTAASISISIRSSSRASRSRRARSRSRRSGGSRCEGFRSGWERRRRVRRRRIEHARARARRRPREGARRLLSHLLGHRPLRAEPRDALGGARLGREQPRLVRPRRSRT